MEFKDFLLYNRGMTLEQAREMFPLTTENALIVAEEVLGNAVDQWQEITDALWPNDTEGVAIKNSEIQLMCYLAKPAVGQPLHVKQTGLQEADQLGSRSLGTIREMELCVPSLRLP